jgi:2-polyprenyl-3-methyl-5-hydroxy-6-metoxy-1,4-benzoquinol methylase
MVYNKSALAWKKLYEESACANLPEYGRLLYGSSTEEIKLRRLVISKVARHFKGRTGLMIDIGCGTGRYLEELSSQGWSALGVDFSMAMLQEANKRNACGLVQSYGGNLAVTSGKADLVICLGMLQSSNDSHLVVSEAARVLKPGGMMILSTLRKMSIYELLFFPLAVIMESDNSLRNAYWYYKLIKARDILVWHDRPIQHPFRRYSEKYLCDLLNSHGFTHIARNYLGKIRKVPLLFNSQSVIVSAMKKCEKIR